MVILKWYLFILHTMLVIIGLITRNEEEDGTIAIIIYILFMYIPLVIFLINSR